MKQTDNIALIVNEKNARCGHSGCSLTFYLYIFFSDPTSDPMVRQKLLELWFLLRTYFHRHRAAWMKAAALRWIEWAWHITLQDNPLPLQAWVRHRNSGHKCLRVWMHRIAEHFFTCGKFHHFAKVHDCHAVRH